MVQSVPVYTKFGRCPPVGLQQVEKPNGNRDGEHGEPHYRDYYPRLRPKDTVQALFDPVQQLWVGGVALVGQDKVEEKGHDGLLISAGRSGNSRLITRRILALFDSES